MIWKYLEKNVFFPKGFELGTTLVSRLGRLAREIAHVMTPGIEKSYLDLTKSKLDKSVVIAGVGSPAQPQMSPFSEYPFRKNQLSCP